MSIFVSNWQSKYAHKKTQPLKLLLQLKPNDRNCVWKVLYKKLYNSSLYGKNMTTMSNSYFYLTNIQRKIISETTVPIETKLLEWHLEGALQKFFILSLYSKTYFQTIVNILWKVMEAIVIPHAMTYTETISLVLQ